jgi:hypothetical protein
MTFDANLAGRALAISLICDCSGEEPGPFNGHAQWCRASERFDDDITTATDALKHAFAAGRDAESAEVERLRETIALMRVALKAHRLNTSGYADMPACADACDHFDCAIDRALGEPDDRSSNIYALCPNCGACLACERCKMKLQTGEGDDAARGPKG